MALTRKNLAFVQLSDVKGDLYAPPANTKGLVHNIILHNTGLTEVVDLYYHDGTNEYRLFKLTLEANETIVFDFRGEGDVVEDGGKYTGNTTTAATVTCKINGTEEV